MAYIEDCLAMEDWSSATEFFNLGKEGFSKLSSGNEDEQELYEEVLEVAERLELSLE